MVTLRSVRRRLRLKTGGGEPARAYLPNSSFENGGDDVVQEGPRWVPRTRAARATALSKVRIGRCLSRPRRMRDRSLHEAVLLTLSRVYSPSLESFPHAVSARFGSDRARSRGDGPSSERHVVSDRSLSPNSKFETLARTAPAREPPTVSCSSPRRSEKFGYFWILLDTLDICLRILFLLRRRRFWCAWILQATPPVASSFSRNLSRNLALPVANECATFFFFI